MRVLFWIGGFIAALFVIWWAWPAQINPAYWDEPEPPAMTGVLEPRGRLAEAELIRHPLLETSEDVAIGPDGAVYSGQHDGSLVRLRRTQNGWEGETVAQITDNRSVLGLQWDAQGRLIAAAIDGVYAVDVATGEVTLLSTGETPYRLAFADDLDIGPDGTIYFTEASWKWGAGEGAPSYLYDLAENRPYGIFYALDPDTGEMEVLADELYFANGVAMAADGQSVFVLETFRYRLSRYWIEGPRAGEFETVAENLPGSPDGLLGDGQGQLYIAMNTQRVPLVRFLHRNPFITQMITKLPQSIWARPGPTTAFVLVMDEEGNFLDSYHDPDERFGFLANAVPDENGDIWLGSLTEGVIGRFTPPD
ncbi:SMP-30/gluconolactonase/LRE family protein [Hyphobacterium sp.]|uniref:SMP-30/gluconolactonase/LRE family protein n=1 Tax=Hyphobacterium sp. TaxID=2004662 RepID=UPI003BA992E6